MTFNPFSWFKKTTPFNLLDTLDFSRDAVHPEKKRSVAETNKEANSLRYMNDMVSSYEKTVSRGVVGTGFALQFKTDDENINTQVEEWLDYTSEKGNADFTKRFFRQKIERMVAKELATKGGVLIRHHWDKSSDVLYSPEIMSIDTIDRTKNNFFSGLYSGIKVNEKGQIEGMYIYDSDERQTSSLVSMKKLEYEVLEYDPHQYGAISPLATIMLRLDDLSTYTAEELKGAKKRAEKSLVAATPAVDQYLAAIDEYIASETKLGTQESKLNVERAVQQKKKAIKDFSAPGFHDSATIMHADTKIFDLQTSGTSQYDDLSRNSKQTIGKAMGYSAATIMGIPENSYNSAMKTAQEEEIENAILGQSVIIICKSIYRKQIEAGVILGELDIPDYYKRKRYYDRRLFVTRKQNGHIDVAKQQKADAGEVELGTDSKIAIMAKKNRDFRDVIKDEVTYEVARKEAFEENGLKYIQTGIEENIEETTTKVATDG